MTFPFADLLAICEARQARFDQATGLSPIAAFGKFVLQYKIDDFTKHFISDEGKAFIKDWCSATTADQRRSLAGRFLAHGTGSTLYLVEWALANVMAEHQGSALDECPP